jgi:hypothetical protein
MNKSYVAPELEIEEFTSPIYTADATSFSIEDGNTDITVGNEF